MWEEKSVQSGYWPRRETGGYSFRVGDDVRKKEKDKERMCTSCGINAKEEREGPRNRQPRAAGSFVS